MANGEMVPRKGIWLVVLFLGAFILLLFMGCSGKYVPLKKEDLSSLRPLTLAYSQDLVGVRHTKARNIPVGGLVKQAFVSSWESDRENEIKNSDTPKLTNLIVTKFADRMNHEIQGWPTMIIEGEPFSQSWRNKKSDYFENKSGSIMLFFCNTMLGTSHPVSFYVKVLMYSAEDDCCFYREFYHTATMQYTIEEYKADNFKILKEEVETASEAIVGYLIKTIKIRVGAAAGTAEETGQPTNGIREIEQPVGISEETDQQTDQPENDSTGIEQPADSSE